MSSPSTWPSGPCPTSICIGGSKTRASLISCVHRGCRYGPERATPPRPFRLPGWWCASSSPRTSSPRWADQVAGLSHSWRPPMFGTTSTLPNSPNSSTTPCHPRTLPPMDRLVSTSPGESTPRADPASTKSRQNRCDLTEPIELVRAQPDQQGSHHLSEGLRSFRCSSCPAQSLSSPPRIEPPELLREFPFSGR